jgi:hypothetical protein
MIPKKKLLRKRDKKMNPEYLALYLKVDSYNPLNEVCGMASVKAASTPAEFDNHTNKAQSICTLYVKGNGKLTLKSH